MGASIKRFCVSRVGVVCLHVRKGHWVVPCNLVGILVSLLGASLQDFALHRERDLHDRNARCRCTKSATVNESSVGAVALQTVTAVIPPRSLREGKASRKVLLLPERSNRGPPIQHSVATRLKPRDTIVFIQQPLLCPSPARRAAARKRRSVRKFNFFESTFQDCGIRVERTLAPWPTFALRRFQFLSFLLIPTIRCFLHVCMCRLVLVFYVWCCCFLTSVSHACVTISLFCAFFA